MADPFNLKRFNLLSGDVTVRNSLISLGGRRVTDVIPGANILDIRIGAATIKQITSDRGYRSGSDYVRRRHTTRRIEVEIELPLDRNTYPDNVNLIRAWADKPEPQQLLLSAYRQWKIDVSCVSLNDFSQKSWWMPITIVLEAYDPYFVSKTPNVAPVGSEFVIGGNVEPLLFIKHQIDPTETVSEPKWILDGGRYICLNRNFTGGNIKIDCTAGSITYNDASVMKNLTLPSRITPFAEVKPGSHLISGPAGGFVEWYERWL